MLENKDNWIKAGRITAEALNYGRTLAKPDAKILDVAEKIEEKIKELGGFPAFPVNISFNSTAAHDTPDINDDRIFGENLVKIDVGAHVDGCIGDSAVSIDFSNQNRDLLKASENALKAALKLAIPGIKLKDIGEAINSEITSLGYNPIVNLSGHSLSKYSLHAGLSIPNYDNGSDYKLEEDMTIAIEPFATTGSGRVIDGSNAKIFSLNLIKTARSDSARMFMKQAEKYEGLPFAKRWINMPALKINIALKELDSLGVLYSFPPLVEKDRGMVSQAEHSVIVKDKPVVFTKIDSD